MKFIHRFKPKVYYLLALVALPLVSFGHLHEEKSTVLEGKGDQDLLAKVMNEISLPRQEVASLQEEAAGLRQAKLQAWHEQKSRSLQAMAVEPTTGANFELWKIQQSAMRGPRLLCP